MAKDQKTDLILSGEASRILQRSEQMVRKYVDAGKLGAMKTADGTRILNRGEVEKFAQELRRKEG